MKTYQIPFLRTHLILYKKFKKRKRHLILYKFFKKRKKISLDRTKDHESYLKIICNLRGDNWPSHTSNELMLRLSKTLFLRRLSLVGILYWRNCLEKTTALWCIQLIQIKNKICLDENNKVSINQGVIGRSSRINVFLPMSPSPPTIFI